MEMILGSLYAIIGIYMILIFVSRIIRMGQCKIPCEGKIVDIQNIHMGNGVGYGVKVEYRYENQQYCRYSMKSYSKIPNKVQRGEVHTIYVRKKDPRDFMIKRQLLSVGDLFSTLFGCLLVCCAYMTFTGQLIK